MRGPNHERSASRKSTHERTDANLAFHACAVRFREDIDDLMKKHRQELDTCFDSWFSSVRELIPHDAMPMYIGAQMESPTRERPAQRDPDFGLKLPGMVATSTIDIDLLPIVPTVTINAPEDQGDDAVIVPKRGERRKRTKQKDYFLSEKLQLQAMAQQTRLERFIFSRYFEWFSFTIIFLNCIFIGVETQFNADQARNRALNNLPQDTVDEPGFWALQIMFCIVFVLELGLRWVCIGFLEFFKEKDMVWNAFDVFVVAFSTIDLIFEVYLKMSSSVVKGSLMGNITVFRVLRIIRVIRVLKVIRVMRFFRELRMMISGILKSTKSMIWVMVVVSTMFYMFGIVFTNATTTYLTTEMRRNVEYQDLLMDFGTIDKAILSLFMSMSGGNDWVVYYNAILKLPPYYIFVFMFFILLSVFVVTNVVIGIFVETAMQSNKDDREVCINDELEEKKSYLKSMRVVFNEIKNEDSDVISFTEFEDKLQDERIMAYFSALKLDVSDARTLFTLLDYDMSGEIHIDEFLDGCYKLQGESKNLDMKIMQYEIKTLLGRIYCLEDRIKDLKTTLCTGKSPNISDTENMMKTTFHSAFHL